MRHHQSFVRDEAQADRAVNRAWIVCASLAIGTHALLLFAIHPDTTAQPRAVADEASAVELSIVESAPAAPAPVAVAAEPPPEPLPPDPPSPVATPPLPEPIPESVREPAPAPSPEPVQPKPTPAPRLRPEPAKSRAVTAPQRSTPASASSGSVPGATAGPANGRGPSTSARPRYRSNPKPDYPADARRTGQQGVVTLAVQVTADGRAASVQLSRSSGFPLLDTAALQAVRRWTFEPARTAGIPTASRVEVPVRFDLAR